MKKSLLLILSGLLLTIGVAQGQLLSPTGGGGLLQPGIFTKNGAVVTFTNGTDTLGNSSDRIDEGWFDSINATNGTIGTLTIGSSVSGDMDVGGFLTVGEGATINDTQANSDFTVKSVGNTAMLFVDASANSFGVGTSTIDPSAIIEIDSTTKGILIPRLTTAQRDAIASPATGLVIVNSDVGRIQAFSGTPTVWLQSATLEGTNTWTAVNTFQNTGLHILDTNASDDLILKPGSNISSDRTLTLTTGDADRTISLAGNLTIAGDLITSGANSITLTTTGATNVTLPTSGTLYGTASDSITSANLLGSLSDETGSGLAVFATSPTLVTPALGAATATTINGLTLTASTGALTITNGKTFSVSNTLTLAGTDSTTITFQGTDTYVGRATTDTLTNKTLTAPRFADLGFIADASGNELVIFDSNASAVNEVTISNAATTADPIIAASGETNTDLVVRSKGTGRLLLNSGDGDGVGIGDTGYSVGAIETATEANTNLVQVGQVTVTGSLVVDWTDEGLRDYASAPMVVITPVYNNNQVLLLQCNPHTITTTGMTIECVEISTAVTADVNADAVARVITYMLVGAVTP